MADPVTTPCPADTWTKIATNVTAGVVQAKDNAGLLLQTYRPTDAPAPTLIDEGMPLQRPSEDIASLMGIDVYIWAKDNAGSVRVDL